MPIKNIFLPEYFFVYTLFEGRVDNLQVQAWADRMKKDLAGFSRCGEIMDLSGNVDFSGLSSETLTCAGAQEKLRPTAGTGPLAILVSNPLTFGLARAYSSLAEEARTEIRIFYTLDECIALMGLTESQCRQIRNRILMPGLNSPLAKTAKPIDFSFPSDD